MTLLRAGLWERDTVLASTPDAPQWTALWQAAREQAVSGLLLRGAAHLPQAQLPPPELRMRMMADADATERSNEALAVIEAGLLSFFREAGLRPLVQKGSLSARHYEKPELRSCGDIDLYLPGTDFEKARRLVPEAKTEADGSAVFERNGITVELHPSYYDLHIPPEKLPVPGSVCGELLLQSAHICKHAIGTGIGLKQLCDMARALYATEGRYEKDELRKALKTAGLLRWHRMLCTFLVEDLGLDAACCLPDFRPGNAGTLRRIVYSGGNFGQAAPRRKAALRKNDFLRKVDTAAAFLRRLPFSLRYAPRETWATFRELTAGNLHKR